MRKGGVFALNSPIFSIHRLAAVTLLTSQNFLQGYKHVADYTDYEKYIVDEIRKFSQIGWFRNQTGNFGSIYSAPFSEILSKRSMAFTFNIMDFDQLMNKQTYVTQVRNLFKGFLGIFG